ncbi:endogenous retrovirus group 3 member 1 Env polyprotein-like [Parus major]|uniref:endogenous retrovirus group 3 member 1 Env polyprotein-like n=1 Tax=Parus major TaxID=9157 RepID=UPI0007712C7A|nr:endogenous retrovirus group 3 member 1 Env polyprotein-like [Parus major]
MGGRVICIGLPWVFLLLTLQEGEGIPCDKCYYPIYAGESWTAILRIHTNPSPLCINFSELTTCEEDGKIYWMSENVGDFKRKLLGECPMKEKWICSEIKPEERDNEGGGDYRSDWVKEKEIKGIVKQGPGIQALGGKNLFLDLAERISREFNITSCWICGDTQMAEIWPWEGIPLTPQNLLRASEQGKTSLDKRSLEEVWSLWSDVIGEECIWRKGPRFKFYVGELPCKRYFVMNDTHKWWIPRAPHLYWAKEKEPRCSYVEREKFYECATTDPNPNPLWGDKRLAKFWHHIGVDTIEPPGFWRAPINFYWICGRSAYVMLPKDWAGSCTLGIIKPSFFLLPRLEGQHLGVPLYDELKRKRREMLTGGTQKWGDDEWPPERIIATYGPATWAQDGSWGYRTPIYMLNRLIRLQAVVEIISNQSSLALDLLSAQARQMRTTIYQNRLALDYLLAEEGGVCGKFNSSECCIEIDDHSEVIKNITTNIRKLAHVPVQKWSSLVKTSWWNNLFNGEWWKKLLIVIGCILTVSLSSLV